MCLFVIKVCVLTIFLQINGEYQDHNKNVQNDAPREVNGTETYKQCVFKEIVSKIEELLRRQINASEFRIKAAIAPPRDFFKPHENNRKIRQVDWNKCISKMDFEEHKDIETGHIEAVKKELEKLRQLVRLLRDQQLVLNLLSDANRPIPKTEDENEQKQLLELLRLLRNNMPAQSKIANNGVPLHPSKQSEGLEKVLEEITKLQNQIQSHSGSNDRTLTTELMIQKKQIATLETEVENLKNGQAIFINVSPNKTSSDVVGARLHPLFAKTPHNFSIDVKKHHGKLDHAANPKVRAGNDEFFDNLLKVLDDSEPAPEIKENQINLNTDRNLNLENRLIDLEKQLKISQKMQQLEKKIKEIHESDAESKSLGDDDEDLKVQVKKLQRQLKNLNKAKVQSKDLEGDDILDELKSLQNAIKDLRPKEDAGQSKIGGAELQIMLNKLIGVPVKPVAVQAHTQLTPTQVQVIKRIMALKAGNHESHSHAPAPQPMFELNGPHGFSYGHYPPIPYNDFYGRVYDQGAYDYHKQYYGYPTSTTPNQYGYSSYNKGDYVPKNKYGPFAQYVFGAAPYVPYKPTSYGYDAKTYVPNSGGTSYEARPPSTIHYPNSKAQTYPANVHIAPPNNGYAQQNQQFFRGYKEGESENYQTDRPELYTNTQENSYAQQKVGDLQAQIYKLQHVIGNLNNPNYVQKPEDQQTIYELDHKIGDLKGIISHMSEDDDYNSAGHGDGDAYYSRHKREITNASVQTNTTILREFFEELSDVISAINYLSENLYDVYGNYSGTTNGTTSGTRRVRETTEAEGGVHQLFHQLSNLMEYVEDLTEKATKYNQTCNNGKNCINAENHRISKRETEDSLDAVTSILGSVLDEDDDDDENTENDRQMQLQKQLDNLKQQLDNKVRLNSHLGLKHGGKSDRRSSYYQPSHYQPSYYHPQPIYYQTIYEDDYKEKDKGKKLKTKLKFEKEGKSDKVFGKILDKILDKIIKSMPKIITKFLGIEIDSLLEKDDYGYDYGYDKGYSVQKSKKSSGIVSLVPMMIFKIVSNISYFLKKLKKNSFVKKFLVPGFVTVATAGLVLFLIWWLTDDDYYKNDSYGHGGSIGYDNGYKNSISYGYNNQNGYYNGGGYRNALSRNGLANDYGHSPNNFKSAVAYANYPSTQFSQYNSVAKRLRYY